MVMSHKKFTGEVYVLKKEVGGRHTPFFSNYRPQFYTDRKSTRLNSSHTEIYTLSLHDALPIYGYVAQEVHGRGLRFEEGSRRSSHAVLQQLSSAVLHRSEEHTSELQSHRDLHSFPTRRSSDLWLCRTRSSRARFTF